MSNRCLSSLSRYIFSYLDSTLTRAYELIHHYSNNNLCSPSKIGHFFKNTIVSLIKVRKSGITMTNYGRHNIFMVFM